MSEALTISPAPLSPYQLYRLIEIAATASDFDVRRAAMQLYERETHPVFILPASAPPEGAS